MNHPIGCGEELNGSFPDGVNNSNLECLVSVSHPNTVARALTKPNEPKLIWVVLRLPVVGVQLVLLLEAAGGRGDVDHHSLGDGEVGPGHRVVLGAGPLQCWAGINNKSRNVKFTHQK